MAELLLAVGALTPCLVLAVAGAFHVRWPGELASAIRGQGLVPGRLAAPLARVVIALELGLGVVGVALGPDRLAHGAGLAVACGVAALFLAFALNSLVLLRSRADAPCGCGGIEPPAVNGLVVGRAFALALATALVVVFRDPLGDLDLSASQFATVLQASIAFTVLLLVLPAAVAGVRR